MNDSFCPLFESANIDADIRKKCRMIAETRNRAEIKSPGISPRAFRISIVLRIPLKNTVLFCQSHGAGA